MLSCKSNGPYAKSLADIKYLLSLINICLQAELIPLTQPVVELVGWGGGGSRGKGHLSEKENMAVGSGCIPDSFFVVTINIQH